MIFHHMSASQFDKNLFSIRKYIRTHLSMSQTSGNSIIWHFFTARSPEELLLSRSPGSQHKINSLMFIELYSCSNVIKQLISHLTSIPKSSMISKRVFFPPFSSCLIWIFYTDVSDNIFLKNILFLADVKHVYSLFTH